MKKLLIIFTVLALAAGAFYWYTDSQFFAIDTCMNGTDCAPASSPAGEPQDDHEEAFNVGDIARATVVLMDDQKAVELSRTGSDRALRAQFSVDDIPIPGSVSLLEEYAIYLSGTGDVLVPYVANYGGSGSFVSVGLFTREGDSTLVMKASYALGDRVLVQKLTTEESRPSYTLRAQFLDRKADEAMAAEPTVLKELTVAVADHRLGKGSIRTLSSAAPEVYKDLIVVDTLKREESISSPLTVSGKARGQWFFEGSFPVVVTDWDGKIIGQGHAEAPAGEWMTTDYVSFKGMVSFTVPPGTPYRRGAVFFKKNNPADMREHDDAFEVPVTFR